MGTSCTPSGRPVLWLSDSVDFEGTQNSIANIRQTARKVQASGQLAEAAGKGTPDAKRGGGVKIRDGGAPRMDYTSGPLPHTAHCTPSAAASHPECAAAPPGHPLHPRGGGGGVIRQRVQRRWAGESTGGGGCTNVGLVRTLCPAFQ